MFRNWCSAVAFALALGFPASSVRGQCMPQELQKLVASDAATGDFLGISAAIDGDTAIAGAFGDDNTGGTDAGAAYVYFRSAGTWTQQAKLTASDAAADDIFSRRLGLSAGTAIIGADGDTHAGGTFAGSAYIFALNCDADGDGVNDEEDVCPGTPAGWPADTTGRPHRDYNFDCTIDGGDLQCIVDEMLNL